MRRRDVQVRPETGKSSILLDSPPLLRMISEGVFVLFEAFQFLNKNQAFKNARRIFHGRCCDIFRAERVEDGAAVVVKVIREEMSTPNSERRLRHEFEIGSCWKTIFTRLMFLLQASLCSRMGPSF